MSRYIFILIIGLLISCQTEQGIKTTSGSVVIGEEIQSLPFVGAHDISEKEMNGKLVQDTVFYKVPEFSFFNQDSILVADKEFSNKITVVDFFFTSCPTVCPKTKANQLKIVDHFKGENKVKFLSHTIDVKHDLPSVLKTYGEKLGADFDQWTFLWGEKNEMYSMANYYMNSALENPAAPGGSDHGTYVVVVDKDRHIRAFATGTDEDSMLSLIPKIKYLVDTQF